jgi:hypothetical protein
LSGLPFAQEIVHAVGGENQHVARLERHRLVVHLEIGGYADSARKVLLVTGDTDTMVVRQ